MAIKQNRPAPPAEDDILENLLQRLSHYAGKYGRQALLVVAAVVIVLLVWQRHRARVATDQVQAWQGLRELPILSPTPNPQNPPEPIIDGCQAILASGRETDATPWVLLKLANAQRVAGRLDRARLDRAADTYRRLLRDYPQHHTAALGATGLAGVLEDLGECEEAARAYEALAGARGEDSRHWLDAGRSWELAGKQDEAERAYRHLSGSASENAAQPPSAGQDEGRRAAQLATFRLDLLAKGAPLLSPPPPPPLAPPAPTPAVGGLDAPPDAPPEPNEEDANQEKSGQTGGKPVDRLIR